MNISPIGTSSVVFVTLSGLFWGGWVVGSQTPQGQEALARAYEAYTQQQRGESVQDLFAPNALRAMVCGDTAERADGREPRPCLAVAAAGRLFIVDAGAGAAQALADHAVPLGRLEAVLLTGAGMTESVDLDELFIDARRTRATALLPVYGPDGTQRVVEGLNNLGGFNGLSEGLQAWGPSPQAGGAVIVFEADGLTVSAFATPDDVRAGRVGYRFDYRGRSLVIAGDGTAEWANADTTVDVVLQSAGTTAFIDDPNTIVPSPIREDDNAHTMLASAAASTRIGVVLELPLENSDVNVRPL